MIKHYNDDDHHVVKGSFFPEGKCVYLPVCNIKDLKKQLVKMYAVGQKKMDKIIQSSIDIHS